MFNLKKKISLFHLLGAGNKNYWLCRFIGSGIKFFCVKKRQRAGDPIMQRLPKEDFYIKEHVPLLMTPSQLKEDTFFFFFVDDRSIETLIWFLHNKGLKCRCYRFDQYFDEVFRIIRKHINGSDFIYDKYIDIKFIFILKDPLRWEENRILYHTLRYLHMRHQYKGKITFYLNSMDKKEFVDRLYHVYPQYSYLTLEDFFIWINKIAGKLLYTNFSTQMYLDFLIKSIQDASKKKMPKKIFDGDAGDDDDDNTFKFVFDKFDNKNIFSGKKSVDAITINNEIVNNFYQKGFFLSFYYNFIFNYLSNFFIFFNNFYIRIIKKRLFFKKKVLWPLIIRFPRSSKYFFFFLFNQRFFYFFLKKLMRKTSTEKKIKIFFNIQRFFIFKKKSKTFQKLRYISFYKKKFTNYIIYNKKILGFKKALIFDKQNNNIISQSLFFSKKILKNLRKKQEKMMHYKLFYRSLYNFFYGDFSVIFQKAFLYRSDFRTFFYDLNKLLLKKREIILRRKRISFPYLLNKIFNYKKFAFIKNFYKYIPRSQRRISRFFMTRWIYNMMPFMRSNSLYFYFNFISFRKKNLFFLNNLYKRFNYWFYFYKYRKNPKDFFIFFLRKRKEHLTRKYKRYKYFRKSLEANIGHFFLVKNKFLDWNFSVVAKKEKKYVKNILDDIFFFKYIKILTNSTFLTYLWCLGTYVRNIMSFVGIFARFVGYYYFNYLFLFYNVYTLAARTAFFSNYNYKKFLMLDFCFMYKTSLLYNKLVYLVVCPVYVKKFNFFYIANENILSKNLFLKGVSFKSILLKNILVEDFYLLCLLVIIFKKYKISINNLFFKDIFFDVLKKKKTYYYGAKPNKKHFWNKSVNMFDFGRSFDELFSEYIYQKKYEDEKKKRLNKKRNNHFFNFLLQKKEKKIIINNIIFNKKLYSNKFFLKWCAKLRAILEEEPQIKKDIITISNKSFSNNNKLFNISEKEDLFTNKVRDIWSRNSENIFKKQNKSKYSNKKQNKSKYSNNKQNK